MMSRLDLLYNAIEINTIHPNYKYVMNCPEDKIDYLLRLTAKEITLFNYKEAKPEILLEKEVGLEICAENALAELLS